jgi:hypothetical protein
MQPQVDPPSVLEYREKGLYIGLIKPFSLRCFCADQGLKIQKGVEFRIL